MTKFWFRLFDWLADDATPRHEYNCGRPYLNPDCRRCVEIAWARRAAAEARGPEAVGERPQAA